MIIEETKTVETRKVSPLFEPTPEGFPHYRLIPTTTKTGRKYCLFFYITASRYLILDNGVQRYQAIRHLTRLLETAPYTVFEIRY